MTRVTPQGAGINIPTIFTPLDKNSRILGNATKTTIDVIGATYPMYLYIGTATFIVNTNQTITIATALDIGSISNGKDYYIYACNTSGALTFVVSLASTFPAGYSTTTSKKIGGFHTLCVNVGVIGGHTLSGYVANDILPQSVWDLRFRCRNLNNVGMVYSININKWVQIYLASDNGASGVQSVFGATHLVSTSWLNVVNAGALVNVILLDDDEFQTISQGSNQLTNIFGSADATTTGGHSDTNSVRMISNIGCEECNGYLYQHLRTQSYRFDGHISGQYDGFTFMDLSQGKILRQGTYGGVKLNAGGSWDQGNRCGSQSRNANNWITNTDSNVGSRFAAEPL